MRTIRLFFILDHLCHFGRNPLLHCFYFRSCDYKDATNRVWWWRFKLGNHQAPVVGSVQILKLVQEDWFEPGRVLDHPSVKKWFQLIW
ncbi:hypothetical protein GBA52_029108 [Prunus armeniaca]|nr:hypothetical protein GBA52_029108 [Prunus armeniaca]